jgi:hypothetical protein
MRRTLVTCEYLSGPLICPDFKQTVASNYTGGGPSPEVMLFWRVTSDINSCTCMLARNIWFIQWYFGIYGILVPEADRLVGDSFGIGRHFHSVPDIASPCRMARNRGSHFDCRVL